jgi:hypothetical protein
MLHDDSEPNRVPHDRSRYTDGEAALAVAASPIGRSTRILRRWYRRGILYDDSEASRVPTDGYRFTGGEAALAVAASSAGKPARIHSRRCFFERFRTPDTGDEQRLHPAEGRREWSCPGRDNSIARNPTVPSGVCVFVGWLDSPAASFTDRGYPGRNRSNVQLPLRTSPRTPTPVYMPIIATHQRNVELCAYVRHLPAPAH